MRFELADLNTAIDALFVSFPELADDEQLRADVLEGETEFNAVLAKLLHMATDAEDMTVAIALRQAELGSRKARFERKETAMRELIAALMEKARLTKVQLATATLSLNAKPIRPIVTNVDELPVYCVKIERRADMAAIKKSYADSGILPSGCGLSNGGTQLTIRSR